MRRIVLAAFFILFPFFLFCQSKSETLDWIASKLVKYGGVPGSGSKYKITETSNPNTGNVIDYTIEVHLVTTDAKNDDFWEYYYRTEVFKLNDVSNVLLHDDGLKFYVTGTKIKKTLTYKSKHYYAEHKTEEEISNDTYISVDWNSEQDLKQRMRTALIKLLDFNKPKETF